MSNTVYDHNVTSLKDQKLDNFLIVEEVFGHIDESLPRHARDAFSHVFEQLSLRKTEFNWMMLAMAEILSNLLKHPRRAPNLVKISFYAFSPKEVMLDISDDASSFSNFERMKKKSLALVRGKKLSDGGRGLALLDKTLPDHEYILKDKSEDGLNHFRIWYPKRKNKEVKDVVPKSHVEEKPSIRERPHVVVVDDDRVIRFLLEGILQTRYDVKSFDHAVDAFEYIKENAPDMIISDLNMPDMDGIELRQALNDIPEGEMIPFIFLSGDEKSATKQYINNLGIDDYLVKPVDKEKLVSVIERLLLRSQQVKNSVSSKVSRNITNILSPSLPKTLSGWECSVRHIAATTGGGDFLLHKQVQDQSCIVLSDVMGHGLEAKFFAYAFAGYLRSVFYSLDDVFHPECVLTQFSKAINQDPLFEATIITCLCLSIQESGVFSCGVAAHPAPYVLKKGGACEQLDIYGPLPGLMGDNKYVSYQTQLEKGDRILFFTDGFSDGFRRHGAADLIEEKLIKKAQELRGCVLEDTMTGVWDYYQSEVRQHQKQDDTTVIILEYKG